MHVQFLCIKIKFKKFGKFSNFKKKDTFFSYQLKNDFFQMGRKNSIFKIFQKQISYIIRRHHQLPKYIFFYENNLKIGFFLSKKRHAKSQFFIFQVKKQPFFRWPGKIQFSKFFKNKFRILLEDIISYRNIYFFMKIT